MCIRDRRDGGSGRGVRVGGGVGRLRTGGPPVPSARHALTHPPAGECRGLTRTGTEVPPHDDRRSGHPLSEYRGSRWCDLRRGRRGLAVVRSFVPVSYTHLTLPTILRV